MRWWWQLKTDQTDLERELKSDLELEVEEQREKGLPPEEAGHAARQAASRGWWFAKERGWHLWGSVRGSWQDSLCRV
jgi:hypothetical protein